jgi:hypothetical protein
MRAQGLAGMSEAELAAWSTTNGPLAFTVGLYCLPFAGIAFLWFIAVVRDRIGANEDRFFATVFLGSGLLFVACVFGAAALAGGAVIAVTGVPRPTLAKETVDLAAAQGYALLFVFGTKLGAVFLVSTATLARRFALFGRWLPIMGYLIAVVLLLATGIVDWVILLLPLWVTLLSVEILRRPLAPAATIPST